MTVVVVGAGIAGAACAQALQAAGAPVRVLDRGRRPGGRMAVRRVQGHAVDLGASYLTVSDPRFGAVVDDWQQRGLARAWTDTFHVAGPQRLRERKPGPVRYGATDGLRALVADLLTGLDVTQEHEVRTVGPGPTVDGEPVDAVVLAMPDPQAQRLLDPALAAELEAVRDRAWEPVLALAAGWAQRSWSADFDGCFVHDSDALGWIADDGRRRGDAAPVLVAHSTSALAARHLGDPDAAGPELLAATRQILQIDRAPAWSHVQRWTYARPAAGREEPFHLGPARVGLCGDGWGAPKVETAWLSGHLLGQALAAG